MRAYLECLYVYLKYASKPRYEEMKSYDNTIIKIKKFAVSPSE